MMTNKVLSIIMALIMLASTFALSGCLNASDDSDTETEYSIYGEDEFETAEANAASAMIPELKSKTVTADKDKYDFTEIAMDYLEHIGDGFKKDELADWIVDTLKGAGYSDDQIELQEFEYENYTGIKKTGHNIVLTVEGEDASKQIIAGGHYDGDGIGDNGSGTALLMANAVGLADIKPHYTLKYIFFDAEEDGCCGSSHYAENMTDEEVDATIYMVNLDSLVFGDYCNIYGGDLVKMADEDVDNDMTEGYVFAADTAEKMGLKVMRTADLDGYFKEHGTGPVIEENTVYTNPWTDENPSPTNYTVPSPATLPASDHVGFMDRGIEYIYFEATNWFAEGENDDVEATSYTGYIETYDYSKGDHGEFMNTKYDTWENLNKYFPGRADAHFRIYSPLLSALLLVE